MPLVNSNTILAHARLHRYGIPSLLAGDLSMIVGEIKAAKELKSPLILAFNQEVTPTIPMEIGIATAVEAARQAEVPVAVILDHGAAVGQVVVAIRHGVSSVMFDGSRLPYEENVRQTREVVRIAHAAGVDVEAELGGIPGSSVDLTDTGPEGAFTDPEQAADFVARTGTDVLAISFGNVHGPYRGEPRLDLERVRAIHSRVEIPLSMHGASGLEAKWYPLVVESGISKVCYYTAMARAATEDILRELEDTPKESRIYHQLISHSTEFFFRKTRELLLLLGSAGKA